MQFLQIGPATIIKLTAVTSVSARDEDGAFVTIVRHFAPSGRPKVESGLLYERFTGEDVEQLYECFRDRARCLDLHEWDELRVMVRSAESLSPYVRCSIPAIGWQA